MSTLALMRFLESSARRYDAGMRLLTLGRVGRLHDTLATWAAPASGLTVLEVGCGTGSVTTRLVDRGARVTAVDQDPAMLEQARAKLGGAAERVTWLELSAAEIDGLPKESVDVFVASLCLSDMGAEERCYVLAQAARLVRPGGALAVGDEVWPRAAPARLLYRLLRAPQALLAWLLVGSVSRPIPDLSVEVEAAGFVVRREQRWLLGSLAAVLAERPT